MKYVPPTGSTDPNAPYLGKNPAIGQQGSRVPPAAIEHPQREILAVIQAAGITPDEQALTQLRDAIQALISAGGTVDIASARTVTSGPSTSPPVSPSANDEVLVSDAPTGAFTGQARKFARWNGASWVFSGVRVGRFFRVGESGTYWQLTSAGWASFTVPISFVAGLQAAIDGKVARAGDVMTGPLSVGYGSGNVEVKDGIVEVARLGGAIIDMKDNGNEDYDVRLQQIGDILRIFGNLDVVGDATLRGNILGHEATLARTISSDPIGSLVLGAYIQMYGSAHGTYPRVLALGNGGAHRIVVDTSGRVGVGVTTPTDLLDVNGNIVLRGNLVGPSAGHALTLGADTSANVTAGGYVQAYAFQHPSFSGRVAMGSGGQDRIAIRAGGALELSGGLGGPGSFVTANGAGVAVWGSLLSLGLTQEIGSVEVRGGIITTAGCLCSAIGTDGNRSETIYQVTLNPLSGVGNAAQYVVHGIARQYAGQTPVYAPNGELTGYAPIFDTATIADQVAAKTAGSFVVQANAYLSLKIYKV